MLPKRCEEYKGSDRWYFKKVVPEKSAKLTKKAIALASRNPI